MKVKKGTKKIFFFFACLKFFSYFDTCLTCIGEIDENFD